MSIPKTIRSILRWETLFCVVILGVMVGYFTWRLKGPTPSAPSPQNKDQQSHLSEFLDLAKQPEESDDPMLGRNQVSILKNELASDRLTPRQQILKRFELSGHLLRLGDLEAATKEIETTISEAEQQGLPGRQKFLARRALVYLRQAEVSNCIKRHNSECCLFPLRGDGIHRDKEPARQARLSLLNMLGDDPENLPAMWLLNLSSMAIGDYPSGTPSRYLIPLRNQDEQSKIKRFIDVAPQLGVDTFNQCGGVVVDDFDNDSLLDIITSTFDPRGHLTFYRNLGNDRYENRTKASGLDQQLGGLNCVATDYDNDGDQDLLVLRGAWLNEKGRMRNSLLRNQGDGTFVDMTRAAGLAETACPTQAAAWGDFDKDGFLDLFIGNESRVEREGRSSPGNYPSQLFHNNGDGTFTDIAKQCGVTNDRYCKGVTAGDYDNDGDLDLYVSNMGKNRLYQNKGDGTFVDVAALLGVTSPESRSFATWFFDYDNDGWLDLFVAAYQSTLADITNDHLGREHQGVAPCLYHNEKGRFREVASSVGLDHPWLPMGANFGDLDNDGYLDFYLATGDPGFETLTPNVMLRNDKGKRFQNVTTAGGFGHLQKGHGVAFADIDNDGDQDVYNQLGGFYPSDKYHNALFQNPGHGNNFITLHLIGTKTNRAAYGARVRVIVDGEQGERTIHRAVGSVSSFGGSPTRQEIGIGDASRIRRVEIDWPRSGTQVLSNMPINSWIRITEGKQNVQNLTRRLKRRIP